MTDTETIRVVINDGVAHVTVDNPPVNALTPAVRAVLMAAVNAIDANHAVKAAVLTGAGPVFASGADLDDAPAAPHLTDVVTAIERSQVPWVAALQGSALGGGLELAMGCHARVAQRDARLGLPEVTLGVIPGAGGTVRLPRLVPVRTAIEMITGGKPVAADAAQASGLVDTVTQGNPVPRAVELAVGLSSTGRPQGASLRDPLVPLAADAWNDLEASLARRSRGQAAPLEALAALKDSVSLAGAEALSNEQVRFLRLSGSPEAAALRYIALAERNTAQSLRSLSATSVDLSRVGVIGGGTMGAGIACALLLSGSSVILVESSESAAETAAGRVSQTLAASVKRGVLTDAAMADALARLSTGIDYEALASCPLVIEAVFEDMAIKREVFERLDRIMPTTAILATNTSYLDVRALAASTRHPERVLGLHFFSPAHVMKLLEIVRTPEVAEVALASGLSLAGRLNKTPVVAGVCDGFIGNRIMAAYRRECEFMLEEGALPQEIDAAMRAFGYAMGIFEIQDMSGLDIAWAMRKRRAATRPPGERYSRVADRLCEAGRLGVKTGAGWYRYEDGRPHPDEQVEAIIVEESARLGLDRRAFGPDDVMARILATMQKEAKAILSEGIAESAADIDVVMVLGFGFPRHRGGPMFMQAGHT